MGCKDCGTQTQGRCDVCFFVRGDKTFKMVVKCNICGAWICQDCNTKFFSRAWAAIRRMYLRLKFGKAMAEEIEQSIVENNCTNC